MMEHSVARRLIQELLCHTVTFNEEGKGYDLLQEYFNGFPVDTLRPLLTNEDNLVRRETIWIVSELGRQGDVLIDEVKSLIYDEDAFIQYLALDSVMVCSFGDNVEQFVHVIRALENRDERIRTHTMSLVSYADLAQLKAAIRIFDSTTSVVDKLHKQGLSLLLSGVALDAIELRRLSDDKEPLIRRYAAITASRLIYRYPYLVRHLASSSDADIQQFSKYVLEFVTAPP